MAEQYLLVRCWPGFTDAFPYDHFQRVPDEEIGNRLDDFVREWEKANAAKLKSMRQKKAAETKRRIEKSRAMSIDRPNALRSAPDSMRETPKRPPVPHIIEIGKFAGWVSNFAGVFGNSATGPLIYLARLQDPDFAEAMMEEMSSDLKEDYEIIRDLNPRYGTVPVSDFSVAQQLSIGRKMVKDEGLEVKKDHQYRGFLRRLAIEIYKGISAGVIGQAKDKNAHFAMAGNTSILHPVPLSKEALIVLDVLFRNKGEYLTGKHVEEILLRTKDRRGKNTVNSALRELSQLGLAAKREGQRKGYSITSAGISRMEPAKVASA